MDFTIPTASLVTVYQRAAGIARPNPAIHILNAIHISAEGNSVTFTVFDGEVAIVSEVPATVHRPGRAMLPMATRDFVSTLKGEVSVRRLGGTKLEFKSGKTVATVYEVHRSEDYPKLPEESGPMGALNAAALVELLARTSYAISKDGSRHNLNGAFLCTTEKGAHRVTTTDSKRLAHLTRRLGDFSLPAGGILVPLAGVVKLEQLLRASASEGWRLGANVNVLVAEVPGLRIIVRLMQERFPEYEHVLREAPSKFVSMPYASLLESVSRVALVNNRITLTTQQNGTLQVEAHSEQRGEALDSVDLPRVRTVPRAATFDARQITDALNGAWREGGDATSFHVQVAYDKDKGLALRTTEEDGYFAIMTPLRG